MRNRTARASRREQAILLLEPLEDRTALSLLGSPLSLPDLSSTMTPDPAPAATVKGAAEVRVLSAIEVEDSVASKPGNHDHQTPATSARNHGKGPGDLAAEGGLTLRIPPGQARDKPNPHQSPEIVYPALILSPPGRGPRAIVVDAPGSTPPTLTVEESSYHGRKKDKPTDDQDASSDAKPGKSKGHDPIAQGPSPRDALSSEETSEDTPAADPAFRRDDERASLSPVVFGEHLAGLKHGALSIEDRAVPTPPASAPNTEGRGETVASGEAPGAAPPERRIGVATGPDEREHHRPGSAGAIRLAAVQGAVLVSADGALEEQQEARPERTSLTGAAALLNAGLPLDLAGMGDFLARLDRVGESLGLNAIPGQLPTWLLAAALAGAACELARRQLRATRGRQALSAAEAADVLTWSLTLR